MEHIVTKQHMEALQALSGVTLQISQSRADLNKLQESETVYLLEREEKAIARIRKVLDDSHALVEETNKNYELIHDLAVAVGEGTNFLHEAYEKFKALVETFEKKEIERERDIKNQEETVEGLRRLLKIEKVAIDSARNQVEADKKELKAKTFKFNDDQAALIRAINRLKEGRI